ncbi:basic amino acid ABC transporter substrate-binding protein [Fictibacillus sp. WQ 8-8]|uniref:basic amino acid ABC transporter substrate-binding protein n=1 Tax=unclassified Fictibacillus TaxID=2644029 RepID=UPI0006A75C57|nr:MULTISPECIES: basic amino acid ABC transporter substrate-binding protein [unclassified Fictibacillus]MCQ6266531.1 basic amino acid ABC transporter substrate-binding protein [Fictibacillus sp. WQ 8-8]MED2971536.1 basic amino acid ABC transporter substrate-binding protein [Fictibacillus sp. B-59209]UZJ80338.1 basic amino acid ABC transporter substrate-binding protein [Fictibacillus sp. KU28468]SFD59803.1 amino acid ABC transporter substrate-binding protein, PAAT family [Bacillus sp. OV194]
MKKVVLLLLLGSLLTLAACGGKSTSGSPSEKLVVGTDAAYAPFEYLKDGKIVGFDVDLLKAVMKEAKLDYKLKNTGWDPLFTSLQSEQVQAGISAITINDDRKKSYDFSSPYFESINKILTKEGSPIKSVDDLKGKKVSVQNGTTGQAALEKKFGKENTNVKKYDSNVLAIQALISGEVDAVVADNTVVDEYAKNNPDKKLSVVNDKTNFESEFYGIAFPKGSKDKAKVDKALKKVIADGTYTKIYKQWFKVEPNLDVLKK